MIVVTQRVWHSIWYGMPLKEKRGRPAGSINKKKRKERKHILKGYKLKIDWAKERATVIERFTIKGDTLEAIAADYGITRERVRQLLEREGFDRHSGGHSTKMFLHAREKASSITKRKEQRALRVFLQTGMSLDDWIAHSKEYGNANNIGSPYQRFMSQRSNSRKRGIQWELTFADWWRLWQESGKWKQRGRGEGYCMARYGDSGPYSIENIYICTIAQNFSDSYLIDHKGRPASRGFAINSYPIKEGRRWQVRFPPSKKRKTQGGFETREEAEQFGLSEVSK